MLSEISQVGTSGHVCYDTVSLHSRQIHRDRVYTRAAGAMESYCLVGAGFPLEEMEMWYKQTEAVCA